MTAKKQKNMIKKEKINPGLPKLRKRRIKHRESMIKNKDRSHQLLAKQHSQSGQFIFEIIQNAEDTKAKFVRFNVRDDCLEIRHNGSRSFQEEDVESITTIGCSTKKVNDIGKFGVGFKAVFNVTDCPSIHSGEYHFKIEDYIVPQDTAQKDVGKETLFVLPFKCHSLRDFVVEKFEEIKIKSENLLFLKNIKEITFEYDGGEKKLQIKKSIIKLPSKHKNKFKVVEANANDEEGSWSFLIIESQVKITGTNHKAQIAFRKEKDKFIKAKNSIFVFFPTNEESELYFFVQAPYKTTPSRENIDFDDVENKEITKALGKLVADALLLMRDLDFLTPNFFELLPLNKHEHREPYASIHRSVVQKLKTSKLLPGLENGKYIYASEALSAEQEKIPSLLDLTEIENFLGKKYKWLSHGIPEGIYPLLSIEQFGFKHFSEKIDKKFIKRKTYEWVDRFYEVLLPIQKHEYFSNQSFFNEFREKPIVPIQDGEYVSPFDSDGEKQVFMPYKENVSKRKSSFHIIDAEILNYKNAKEFFKQLGIGNPNKKDEIKKFILPHYKAEVSQVGERKYRKDILFIADACSSKKENLQEITEILKNAAIVLTESGEYRKPKDVYIPTKEIRKWFDGNNEVSIAKNLGVTPEEKQKIENLFESIGCSKRIEYNNEKWRGVHRHGHHENSNDGFNPAFCIAGIEYSLEHISLERSVILWKILLRNHRHFRGTIQASSRQSGRFEQEFEKFSDAGEKINDSRWLYNTEGELIPQSSIKNLRFKDLHDDYEKGEDIDRDKLVRSIGMLPESPTQEEYRKIVQENIEKDKKIDRLENELKESRGEQGSRQEEKLKFHIQSSHSNNAEESEFKPTRRPDGSSIMVVAQRPDPVKPHLISQEKNSSANYEPNTSRSTNTPAEVGRWGEEEVFLKLKKEYLADEAEVMWANESQEAHGHYDIIVKRNGNPDIYVEVKTTKSDSPHTFEVTGAQWRFACRCQQEKNLGEYQIYAVFNAGTDESKISELKNPVGDFYMGNLDAYPLGLRIA